VSSLSVSPLGNRVAVGFLDKVLRIFTYNDLEGAGQSLAASRDWVGFSAAVSCLGWSEDGAWLGAVGGTAILAIHAERSLDPTQPPTLCRTEGEPEADGCPGGCGRFTAMRWSPSPSRSRLLAALEAQAGRVHIFDVTRSTHQVPKRVSPMWTFTAPGAGPATTFAFANTACGAEQDLREDSLMLLVARRKTLSAFQVPSKEK
jgi:WD40 repeat protein